MEGESMGDKSVSKGEEKYQLNLGVFFEPFKHSHYRKVFLLTCVAAFFTLIALSLAFPFGRFLFFSYFLPKAIASTMATFGIMIGFSLLLAASTVFVLHRFSRILQSRQLAFFMVAWGFLIVGYLLTFSNTSFSIFSYAEMNGVLFTLLSMLLLAPAIPLTSLLLLNVYVALRYASVGAAGIGGVAASLFSLGCPSCGAFLLSLVGVGAGLSVFPFEGLGMKLLSLFLLGFVAYRIDSAREVCIAGVTERSIATSYPASPMFESALIIASVFVGVLVVFNSAQLGAVSASLNTLASTIDSKKAAMFSSTGDIQSSIEGNQQLAVDLSKVDVSKVNSTAMALATVFPGLKSATTQEEVVSILLPSGTPAYSEALGGISFDDPVNSLEYLSRWYFSLKDEVKQNDPDAWQRYLQLAAAPRGISCEFCCGVGPQGIDEQGNLRCGCKHNPALQAIALGLIKYTDYSDAEVLREVMRWKTIFFPRSMVELGVKVAGKDVSQISELPGMVGGC
jgi:hypothetical protein